MYLDFGESWIYYIEIVRYNERRFPEVIGKVLIREKVNNIKDFEQKMENEINSKLTNKIKIQAAAKRRPTRLEVQENTNKIGTYYIEELKKGSCTYSQVADKFKIPVDTAGDYINKYFKQNSIGKKTTEK